MPIKPQSMLVHCIWTIQWWLLIGTIDKVTFDIVTCKPWSCFVLKSLNLLKRKWHSTKTSSHCSNSYPLIIPSSHHHPCIILKHPKHFSNHHFCATHYSFVHLKIKCPITCIRSLCHWNLPYDKGGPKNLDTCQPLQRCPILKAVPCLIFALLLLLCITNFGVRKHHYFMVSQSVAIRILWEQISKWNLLTDVIKQQWYYDQEPNSLVSFANPSPPHHP